MKKILFLFLTLLLPYVCYSQCEDKNTPTKVKLKSENLIETEFQLCHDDTLDLLIVTQDRLDSEIKDSKKIKDATLGNFFLKGKKITIFTTDKNEFQIKLIKEEKFVNTSNPNISSYYFYYVITKSKLRNILNRSIDLITILTEDEIQYFELTHSQSVELYNMVYQYFRYRNWK